MSLTPTEFVMAVLIGSFALIALASLISRATRRAIERHGIRQRVVCRLCLHAFENPYGPSIIKCPACGVKNETGS